MVMREEQTNDSGAGSASFAKLDIDMNEGSLTTPEERYHALESDEQAISLISNSPTSVKLEDYSSASETLDGEKPSLVSTVANAALGMVTLPFGLASGALSRYSEEGIAQDEASREALASLGENQTVFGDTVITVNPDDKLMNPSEASPEDAPASAPLFDFNLTLDPNSPLYPFQDSLAKAALASYTGIYELGTGLQRAVYDGVVSLANKIGGSTGWWEPRTVKPYSEANLLSSTGLSSRHVPSPFELADMLDQGLSYQQNADLYSVGGSLPAAVATGVGTAKLMSTTGPIYKTLTLSGEAFNKAGKFSKMIKRSANKLGINPKKLKPLFINREKVQSAVAKAKDNVARLASVGVPANKAAKLINKSQLAITSGIESAKAVAYGELGAYAVFGNNQTLYPSDLTFKEQLAYNALLPVMGGTIGWLRELSSLNKSISRAHRKAANVTRASRATAIAANSEDPQFTQANYLSPSEYSPDSVNAGDASVMLTHELKAQEQIYNQIVSEVNSAKPDSQLANISLRDLSRAYHEEHNRLTDQRLNSLGYLTDNHLSSADAAHVTKLVASKLDVNPNIGNGLQRISLVPDTNAALDSLVGNLPRKQVKLRSKISRAKKDSAREKYEAQLAKLGDKSYSVLTEDGTIVPAADYHVSFRDNSANWKKIRFHSNPFNPKSKVEFLDEDFGTGRTIRLEADYSGNLLENVGNQATPSVSSISVSASDAGWGLLQNNLGKLKAYVSKLKKNQTKAKLNVDLSKAGFQQLDYLSEAYDLLGDEDFNRLFRLSNTDKASSLLGYAPDQASSIKAVIDDLALLRKQASAVKLMTDYGAAISKGKLPKYSLNSLIDEVFNLKATSSVDPELAKAKLISPRTSLNELRSSLAKSDRLAYKPKKPALLEVNGEVDLTKSIRRQTIDNLVTNRQRRMSTLLGTTAVSPDSAATPTSSSFVSQLSNAIVNNPLFEQASRVDQLAYGVDQLGSLGKYILQTSFRAEDNLTKSAMTKLNSEVNLRTAKLINAKLKPLNDVLTPVASDANKLDKLNRFIHQSRSGWYMADAEPVDLGNGQFAISLDPEKTATNARVAQRQSAISGKSISVGDFLPDPLSPDKPLVFDQQTAEAIKLINSLSQDLWENQRQISTSLGKRTVAYRPYHVPAKDLSNKYVKVITKLDGTPVTYVSGNTPSQVDDLARREISLMPGRETQYRVGTLDEIEAHKALLEEDTQFYDLSDFSDMVRQAESRMTSQGQRTSVGNLIDQGRGNLQELVISFNKAYQKLARRTRIAVFKDQFDYALADLASARGRRTGATSLEYNDLRDYVEAMRGNSPKLEGAVGSIYDAIDDSLAYVGESISDLLYNVSASSRKKAIAELRAGHRRPVSKILQSFSELHDLYGASPTAYDDALGYLKTAVPNFRAPTPKGVAGSINRFLANSMLMIGNFSYAMLNVMGLPVVGSMVNKMLKKPAALTAEEWQQRVGLSGKVRNVNGEILTEFDLTGHNIDTVKWLFSEDAKNVAKLASDSGYFSSVTAMFNEVLVNPAQGNISRTMDKVTNALASVGTKSEEFSRFLPFMSGYRLIDKTVPELSQTAKLSFANKYANDIVGNYASSERPLLYTQAYGMPLGLFRTYALNISQKILDNVSLGNYKPLATLALAQSMMFGAASLPGYETLENYARPINSGDNGYSALARRFGDDTARLVLYGLPSKLTGLDFSSKGTINDIRTTLIPNPLDFVGLSTYSDLASGFAETAKALTTETGLSTRRLAEIWQTRLPSTPGRSLIDIGLGYTTDKQGNVVVSYPQAREGIGLLANLLSMKTLDEAIETDMRYKESQRIYRQQANMATLRKNAGAAIRGNSLTGDEVKNLLADYIAAGGNPENFGNWLGNQMLNSSLFNRLGKAILNSDLNNKSDMTSVINEISLFSQLTDDDDLEEDGLSDFEEPVSANASLINELNASDGIEFK